MTHLHHSVNGPASPLTPLPGDTHPPLSTSAKSHLGHADISATPSRIVGNSDRLGSPLRGSSIDMKRKTRRQSDSVEPSGRRGATRKGKTSFVPEEDPNAKDLEAVENAIKDTLGESNATSDESHDPVHKHKRKLDGQGEYPSLSRVFTILPLVTLQPSLLRPHQSGQSSVKGAWVSSVEVELGRTKSSCRAT
jgi:hypothetical protein